MAVASGAGIDQGAARGGQRLGEGVEAQHSNVDKLKDSLTSSPSSKL